MRRYNDPIEVRSTPTGAAGSDDPGTRPGDDGPGGLVVARVEAPPAPQAFIWHGRLYVVRRVLSQWRERRAWWREALDPLPGQPTGIDVASREHCVWRVEASPGRASGAGVFDLVHDEVARPGESGWRLVRVAD